MTSQRTDYCPTCGTARTELVVAPGRFYCDPCGVAGPGPRSAMPDGTQLDLFRDQPAEDPDPEPQPTQPAHRCTECGHVGDDVMYGLCAECFKRWQGDAA